ncbi:hypothetical protein HY469_03155 [Candidatus Roizmanbacteria bacterium]|nr:hypothetical protein [Candidatus Roizmanbacteria bacterium]
MVQEQTRIPTLVALVLIAALSVGGLFAYDRFSSFLGAARTGEISPPEYVTVTNITESSAVVVWKTAEPIAATVRYASPDSPNIAYDIRDTDSIPKPYRIHYVQLSDLPLAGSVSYEIVLSSQPFPQTAIQLGPSLTNTPQALPIYGEIQTEQGTPTRGAIILARLENGAYWSSFISDTTSWVLPIAPMRTADLTAYYCEALSCSAETRVSLTVFAEEGESTVTASIEQTQPLVDPIIIGQPYRTTVLSPESDTSEASISATPTSAALVKGIQTTPTSTSSPTKKPTLTSTPTRTPTPAASKQKEKNWHVSILNPKEDTSLRFPKPLIRGEGVPGAEVTITLESKVRQIDTVTVKDDGTWLWTPKLPLEPGSHTVTIQTVDASGKAVKLSRTFSIFKSGEQVLAASTPSATLAPTTAPSIIPTSTPILPTATPTPDMPVSASFLPSVMFVAGGLMLVLLGLAVL